MSDTILSSRWIVYYEADNRQQRLARDTTVSPTTIDTVNQVYTALQDLFDGYQQMDDGTPIKAITPTNYNIGMISAGDDDPWFIDQESTEYLKGGSLQTVSWARIVDSNTGIVRINYTETTPLISTDIGKTIVMTTDGDSGTILDFNSTALEIFIRPADESAGNSFDNTPTSNGAFTITSGTGVGNQSGAATTGEYLFTNLSSDGLTSLQDNTTLNVYQDGYRVTSYKDTIDWWNFGNIDILVPVKKDGYFIDEGFLTVTARRANSSYWYFIVDASAGGKNPIPLSAGIDFNDRDGVRQMVITTGGTAEPQVDEIIQDVSDSTIQGVITSVSGANPNVTLQYYLIGDPLNDFSVTTGALLGQDSGFTATAVDPTDVNGGATSLTITFGAVLADVNNDTTNEPYSITLDCGTNPLLSVYKATKNLTKTGSLSTSNTDGIEGQQYLGSDYRISYTTLNSGPLSEGTTVTQQTSGATGTVVAHHTGLKILVLRNSRGTFDNTNQIDDDFSSANVTGPTSVPITPNPASPFGQFAGGKFFTAPGVLLTNVLGSEANNYELTDDTGTIVSAPLSVSFELTGLISNSEVRIYNVSTGLEIDGTDSSGTTFSHNYVFSTNISIYVVIFHLSYREIRLTGLELTDTTQSIPIQQQIDRVYSNP